MKWIKDSVLDIIFLCVIISTLFYTNSALFIVIWVYTVLLLIAKVIALFMPFLEKRASKTETPDLVYHLIYGISFALFIYMQKWYLAAAWLLIWGISFYVSLKQKRANSNK